MSQILNVSLIGFPNSGKTTLYNWLTGAKFKTVNYPGSTTEYNKGHLATHLESMRSHEHIHVHAVDTPGVYSFNPKSVDEEVTQKIISGTGAVKTDVAALVVDSTQLDRQLLLAKYLIEAKIPFVVILTMVDLLAKDNYNVNTAKLSEILTAQAGYQVNVVTFEGQLGKGLKEVVAGISNEPVATTRTSFKTKTFDDHTSDIKWAADIASQVSSKTKPTSSYFVSRSIDKYLLHPVFGYLFFFVTMGLLFSSIYWFAAPFMDAIDTVFGDLGGWVSEHVPGLLGSFLSDGIVAAIGGTVIFIPQIFILFALIYILESSGYLARVAVLIDRPMRFFGLGGRSFVPMLSGFGCAIPAIIATRNITSRSERLIAQSLIPLLTCSARIPVYSLILTFLMKDQNPLLIGFSMAGLYFMSLIVASIASLIISRIIKKSKDSFLLMDLPVYRRPRFKVVLTYAYDKSMAFIKRAGPIIFALSIVLWVLTTFPKVDPAVLEANPDRTEVSYSYAAQIGEVIEPVFKPMGLDWRVGFGIISAFAAREVFVSSLALIFNVPGEDEQAVQGLLDKMSNATFPDGTPIFTLGSSLALLFFFMIAMQCLATFAILKKETGSFKIAVTQLVLTNVAAYVIAVAINQIVSAFY